MFRHILASAIVNLKLLKQFILWYFEDSQKSLTNRFDFLDGYRGLCALTVTLHHLVCFYPPGDFQIFFMSGFYIGVYGFFVLSAFLLTYRMTKDFNKTENITDIIEITIKYAIRRFFRIYIPYMFFVTCVAIGPEIVRGVYGKYYNTWFNQLMLQPSLGSHLWTIPVEIKYYFMIPFICLIYHCTRKYWFLTIICSIGITYVLFKTYFNFTEKEADIAQTNNLYVRFPIFFAGSIVAFIFIEFENLNKEWKDFFKHRLTRFIFCLVCYWMANYGIKKFLPYYTPDLNTYKDSLHPGIKFSYLLFVMLISAPNDFTRLLSENFFLKKIGKFSFGFYLWHPMCITYILGQKYEKRIDTFAGVIILTQLCAILFYFLLENPLMKSGNYFINKIDLKPLRDRINFKSDNVLPKTQETL